MVANLSVCIPIYNFAKFIPETLDSILAQDGADEIEIVILDGASTDNTAEIVEGLPKEASQHQLCAPASERRHRPRHGEVRRARDGRLLLAVQRRRHHAAGRAASRAERNTKRP